MEADRFVDLLDRGTAALGLPREAARFDGLYRYFLELVRWNKTMNLVSRESREEQLVEKHFIDSLALLLVLPGRDTRVLDVGSGAGFPGLVCKTLRPDMAVTLLEPRLKRVSFLRHVVRTLRLQRVVVVPQRLEEQTVLEDETEFNWVASRAVTDIGRFLGMCDRFGRSGCRVVCMKGPRYREELANVKETSGSWMLESRLEYELPFSGAARALLVFRAKEPERGRPAESARGDAARETGHNAEIWRRASKGTGR